MYDMTYDARWYMDMYAEYEMHFDALLPLLELSLTLVGFYIISIRGRGNFLHSQPRNLLLTFNSKEFIYENVNELILRIPVV
jgi:hypothetical protein